MKLLGLPSKLRDIQSMLRALDWRSMGEEVTQELQSRLAIVGPVNSGKSTLFNRLHGRKLSAVSAVPGTTQGTIEHPIGPFLLVDTPGFGEVWGVDRAASARTAAASADLILLLLDAAAGVRQSDHDLYSELQDLHRPVIIALNKVDLVKDDLPWIMENVEQLLGERPIPISARTGDGIADRLLPAVLDAHPPVAVAMARALPDVRQHLVARIIRRTAWLNALVALQPIPGVDVPVLLAAQTRMVLRIAAAYRQPMDISHARELMTTIAGSLLSRYLGGQLAKLIPGPGWVLSAAIAAFSTWGIGQAARRYFEAGRRVPAPELRTLYRKMRRLAPKRLLRKTGKEGTS
jgi:small GTP-binding protein